MWTRPRQSFPVPPPTEESCPLAEFTPPTGHEPKLLDNFHNSQTTEMIFQEESGDIDTEPSYLCDAELDNATIGKALSSPLFIQERGESADRRQVCHSYEETLLPAQSFFAHTRTVRPAHELSSCRQESSREMENEAIRILLGRQKEQILADQKHKFQADSDRRSIQELNELSSLREKKLIMLLQSTNNCFCTNNFQNNRDLREAHMKSLNDMEELERVQGSRFDEFSRKRLIENQDTIHELTARIQELQNEVNCMNDSRDF